MDVKNPLSYDNRYAILIIEKGSPKSHGLPSYNYGNCFLQPSTIGGSWRLFSTLEDCIAQSHKGNNEYSNLN